MYITVNYFYYFLDGFIDLARQFMKDAYFAYHCAVALGVTNPEQIFPLNMRYRFPIVIQVSLSFLFII